MDHDLALHQLSDAFKQSSIRIQFLEDSLAHERQIHAETRADSVLMCAQLGCEVKSLRQTIASLEKDAAKDLPCPVSSDASPNWQKQLTIALEGFTQTEVVKSQYVELQQTVHSLRDENQLLNRKLHEATAEAVTAAELRAEAEEDEAPWHEKYTALNTTNRELKRAYSELKAEQAELVANATAYERIALDVAQEKANVDTALRKLQQRYDDLKAKKSRKSAQLNSGELTAQVKSLTAEVSSLKEDLAKAIRSGTTSAEALSKLERTYRAQKDLSREIQRQYDRLSSTNQETTKRCIALEKDAKADREIKRKYDDLRIAHDELKTTCGQLEAQNAKLTQDCGNLWETRNDLAKSCADVVQAAEKMDADAIQMRNTISALREESRGLQYRLQQVIEINDALRGQRTEPTASGSKRKVDEISPEESGRDQKYLSRRAGR
ncbi:hypothetical protein C8R44DRAFT_798468 [Mycena epipterygia]|nr:hypothetical protein C8R44DRAFT_798468 [Mycena epipterygia]